MRKDLERFFFPKMIEVYHKILVILTNISLMIP